MPLRLTMKPNERLYINGACIRFGDHSTSILLETQARFMRESEVITEAQADTVAKRLYLTLTAIYLGEPERAGDFDALLLAQMKAIVEAAPSTVGILAEIETSLSDGKHYKAMRRCRDLIAYEESLMARAGAEAA